MVALTGVEPASRQSSSVQLGLSSCVFGLVQFAARAFRAVRMADVLPRCCPAPRIRLLAGQSKTRRPARQGVSGARNPTSSEYPGSRPRPAAENALAIADIRRYRSLSGELRPHGLAGALLQQFAGVLRKNAIHRCQIAFGESPTRRTRVRLRTSRRR